MKKEIINAITQEITVIDLTADEVTQREIENTESITRKEKIIAEKETKDNLKASAKAKLIAGEPLTEEEADTIVL